MRVQIPKSLFRRCRAGLDLQNLGEIGCFTRFVENDTWQVSISAMDTGTAVTSTSVSGSETLAFSWETFKPEKWSISRFMGTGIRRNRRKSGRTAYLGP